MVITTNYIYTYDILNDNYDGIDIHNNNMHRCYVVIGWYTTEIVVKRLHEMIIVDTRCMGEELIIIGYIIRDYIRLGNEITDKTRRH